MARRRLDLSGRTFTNIKVDGPAGTSPKGASLWRCTCSRCGSEFTTTGYRLTDKKRPIKDCGCSFREKRADLTSKTFGALAVIERDGVYPSGDIGYLCRCGVCGGTKRFPASTIRCSPKSCGCVRPSREKLKEISAMGVAATMKDGVNIYAATREAANANSHTGLRWVRILRRPSGDFIFAVFYVGGERHYRGGFASPESAHSWALEEHRRVVQAKGIERPSKNKKEEPK